MNTEEKNIRKCEVPFVECRVEIVETLRRVVTVKVSADSEKEAANVVREMYRNEEIILDNDDLANTEFKNLSSNK